MLMAILNAFSHFLVDWTCICALYSSAGGAVNTASAVVLYNTFAFSTQCVFGMLLDIPSGRRRLGLGGKTASVRFCGLAETAGMLMVCVGAAVPLGFMARVAIFGLGNSIFHVGGGMVTLEKSCGKAAPLGVFVAPGAFGVTLGTLYPQLLPYAIVLLALAASSCIVLYVGLGKGAYAGGNAASETMPEPATGTEAAEAPQMPVLPVALLTAAVAVRAIGGSAAEFSWKQGAFGALILTLSVFLGKFLGGFASDRFGAGKMSSVTIPLAALLTAFLAFSMPASLAGQMLLNMSMPVTLYMLYRLLPQDPGLAFGLAASALWPGHIAGMFIRLSGASARVLIIVSFLFGLAAIIYSERYHKK